MKRNHISIIIVVILLFGGIFVSCQKDEFTEEDAIKLQDDLQQERIRVDYTISLVDAGIVNMMKSTASVNGMAGVKIVLSQEGTIVEDTTNTVGMAVFPNLKIGTIAVAITKEGYADVNYTAILENNSSQTSTSGGKVSASNLIPMIPTTGMSTSKIKGKLTCDTVLTNQTVEAVPAGTKVVARIRSGKIFNDTKQSGATINSIAYGGLTLETVTDANGNYELTVPATADPLEFSLSVPEFQAMQTIIINDQNAEGGAKVANILTSYSLPTSTSRGIEVSDIPVINPVYANIQPPEFNFSESDRAQVNANKGVGKGIDGWTVDNAGTSYRAGNFDYVLQDANAETNGKLATVTVQISSGSVTNVTLKEQGWGYADAPVLTISHVKREFAGIVNTIDAATGAITTVRVDDGGAFFTDQLQFNIESTSGTSANIGNNLSLIDNGEGFLTVDRGANGVINISSGNGGANYSVGDKITATVVATAQTAQISFNLTEAKIWEITVANPGTGKYTDFNAFSTNDITAATTYVEFSGSTGFGAKAIANVVNGKVDFIRIIDGGTGYTEAPTITVYNMVYPESPEVLVTVDEKDGKIKAVTDLNGNKISQSNPIGSGYTFTPTIEFIPIVDNMVTTPAQARTIVSGGAVVGIIMINQGEGYLGFNYINGEAVTGMSSSIPGIAPTPTNVEIDGTGSIVRNIYLGTGVRAE